MFYSRGPSYFFLKSARTLLQESGVRRAESLFLESARSFVEERTSRQINFSEHFDILNTFF